MTNNYFMQRQTVKSYLKHLDQLLIDVQRFSSWTHPQPQCQLFREPNFCLQDVGWSSTPGMMHYGSPKAQ